MSPDAAYLHVPFCTHRCGYCNFTLISGRADLVPAYLDALERVLSRDGVRPVSTLYCGGGTPSYLTGPWLPRFLAICRQYHPLRAAGEWSFEANPHDLTEEIAAEWAAAGATRVSLGAQSFSPRKLTLLERDHDAVTIRAAVAAGRAAGLSVNVDLIFAAPEETVAEWQADLEAVIALQPDHVSTYGLTWEQGTQFWNRRLHGRLQAIPEEREGILYELAIDRLSSAGWQQYEVSNFARPGHQCRHNLVYWSGGEYYAAGPGAARHVDGIRSSDHRSTTTWLQRVLSGADPTVESETLSSHEKAAELMVFGLRRIAGVQADWFRQRTGLDPLELIGARGRDLIVRGLLAWNGQTLRLTRAGLMVADSICAEVLQQ